MSTPLTPPSSRSRKENIIPRTPPAFCAPPSPSTSRSPRVFRVNNLRGVSRVLFAPTNKNYPHSSLSPLKQPRRLPSSNQLVKPTKSILKHSSFSAMSDVTPSPPTDERPASPEPENPLMHAKYITSPLRVILASLVNDSMRPSSPSNSGVELGLKDLTEAWSVLFNRLRPLFPCEDEAPAALDPIRDNIDQIVLALDRDVRRALVDPISAKNVERDIFSPTEIQGKGKKKGGLTEFEVTYARDLYMLSSASLKFLSALFWVPQLNTLVPDELLSSLLRTLMTILATDELPTPNPRKTYTMATAVLQVQALPAHIVAPHAEAIVIAVKRGLEGGYGREGKKGAGWECLGIISTIVNSGMEEFYPYMPAIIPALLTNLTSPASPALRTKAAIALGAVGRLCARVPGMSDIPEIVISHFKIREILRGVFNSLPTDAAWGYTVLAGYISICRHRIFEPEHAPALEIILHCMDVGFNLKGHKYVKLVTRMLWTMLVEAWDTVRDTTDIHPEYPLTSHPHSTGIWSNAGRMIRQPKNKTADTEAAVATSALLHHPVGVACVASCVSRAEDDEAVQVGIDIVGIMLASKIPHNLALLQSLLAGFPSFEGDAISEDVFDEYVWDRNKLLPAHILSGRLLISNEAEPKALPAMIRQFFEETIQPTDVRPLSAMEVQKYWPKLIDCWKIVLKIGLPLPENEETQEENEATIGSNLLSLWHALINAHLQPQTPRDDIDSLGTKFFDLLHWLISNPSKTWAADAFFRIREEGFCRFAIPRRLFGDIREQFVDPRVLGSFVPDMIDALIEVLKDEDEGDVVFGSSAAEEWAKFINDLVSFVATPTSGPTVRPILLRLCTEIEVAGEAGKEIWGPVWIHLATLCSEPEVFSWEDVVAVANALPEWPADEHAEIWTCMLDSAIEKAASVGVTYETVADSVVQGFEDLQLGLYGSLKACAALLNGAPASLSADSHPPHRLLAFANMLLETNKPEAVQGHEQCFDACLELILALTSLVKTSPTSHTLSLLVALEPGVSAWLRDSSQTMTVEQYNEFPAKLYITSLDVLRSIPPNPEALRTLTPFLTSAFVHIPDEAICPQAFQDFWKATYIKIGSELSKVGYPEALKPCLRFMVDLEGPDFAMGLSSGIDFDIETQEHDISVVPESVDDSSSPHRGDDSAYDADVSAYPLTRSAKKARRRSARPHFAVNPSLSMDDSTSASTSSGSGLDADMARFIDSDDLKNINSPTTAKAPHVLVPATPVIVDQGEAGSSRNAVERGLALDYDSTFNESFSLGDPRPTEKADGPDEDDDESIVEASLSQEGFPPAPIPVTPQKARPSPSESKRRRHSTDLRPRKRQRKSNVGAEEIPTDTEDNSDLEGTDLTPRNLITSFVEGANSVMRSLSKRLPTPSSLSPTKARRFVAASISGSSGQTGSSLTRPPLRTEIFDSVELPTMKELSMKVSPGSAVSKAPVSASDARPADTRSLKRTRSLGSEATRQNTALDPDLTPLAQIKRQRSNGVDATPTAVTVANVQIHVPSSDDAQALSSVHAPSDDSAAMSETPVRGPALPAQGETVISPDLKRSNNDENPPSDDSLQSSSPIRSHVDRRNRNIAGRSVQRTQSTSSILQQLQPKHTSPEDVIVGVEQAFSAISGIRDLDKAQLLRIRALLRGVMGEVEDSIEYLINPPIPVRRVGANH